MGLLLGLVAVLLAGILWTLRGILYELQVGNGHTEATWRQVAGLRAFLIEIRDTLAVALEQRDRGTHRRADSR